MAVTISSRGARSTALSGGSTRNVGGLRKMGQATGKLSNTLGTQVAEDRTKQLGRESGAIAALKEAMALFDENYGKGAENRALTAASSNLISSGLGNTTRPGAVSVGLSAEFEDMRRGRMSSALSNLPSFLGSYRDPTMVTPGLALQEKGQEQQYQLGLGRLGVSAMGRGGGGARRPTFTPGPVNLAKPTPQTTGAASPIRLQTAYSDDFSNPTQTPQYGGLGDFDPAAANAKLGNFATGF